MSRVIAQRQLRNDNAAVIAAVLAGETFVITRAGTPVAELRPVAPERRRFVPRADIAAAFAASPRINARRLREDLDLAIDQRLP